MEEKESPCLHPISNRKCFPLQRITLLGRFTGLWWIISLEPKPVTLPIPSIEDIIYSEDFLQAQGLENQLAFLMEKYKIYGTLVEDIVSLTIGQRDNPLWHLIRRQRLTASKFGVVLHAKRVTPSLIKRLMGEKYDISRVKAATWGFNNETEAVKAFEKSTGLATIQTGIWLDQSGIFGASPDGLVGTLNVAQGSLLVCPRVLGCTCLTCPGTSGKSTDSSQHWK
jgi:hypothetical protein